MTVKPTRPKANAPRLFIAEDDAGILELLVTRLELAGYEVSTARNGWRALEGIQAMRPDGVILDINMPGMDGFAVLKGLRAARQLEGVPVLMLTARGAREDVAQAIKLGARDYITKPFDEAELLQRVARLIRRRPGAAGPPGSPPSPNGGDSILL